MAYEFRLPDIGEGLTEAEIVNWLVAVGDHVTEDQPFVEIETDKAVVEMPSPATGTVTRLGGAVGDVIPVGGVLVVIEDGVDSGTPAAASASPTASIAPAAQAPQAAPAPPSEVGRRPAATPATRALARRLGVDLALVSGSGPGGRILDADVTAAVVDSPAAPLPAPTVDEPVTRPITSRPAGRTTPVGAGDRIPLRGIRKRTAETMTAAWQSVPHVDSFHEIDVTELFALRAQLKPVAAERQVELTLTAFFVKATALALVDHPILNASLDLAAGEIVLHPARHVAVAVDTPDGLVLPVVRDADAKPVLEIARDLARLGNAARDRRLTPAEMSGSTFTVSNHGVFGGWFGTSLVHGSEVGIVGFGPALKRPVFDDSERIVARRILVMNAAADHRVVDGRDIIAFCVALRRRLEAPLGLLLEDA